MPRFGFELALVGVGAAFAAACSMANPAFLPDGDADEVADDSFEDAESDTASGSGTGTESETGTSTTETGTSTSSTDEDSGEEASEDPCPPPTMNCGGDCVDVSMEPQHCGGCDSPCEGSEDCIDGMCVVVTKWVFVTSMVYQADFGGWQEGIDICAERAEAGGLSGEFLPWLGTAAHSPKTDFTGDGPWVRTDGVLVAESWLDLIDGVLDEPINLDEHGEPGPALSTCNGGAVGVWTGVFIDGGGSNLNCGDWTDSQLQNAEGLVGNFESTTDWTDVCTEACFANYPIYCFEQ